MTTHLRIKACYFVLVAMLAAAPAARGQGARFAGAVTGDFIEPIGGSVEGVGTNTLRFLGDSPEGSLHFTAAAGYSAADHPFLLGRVEFTAGGDMPSQVTFRVGLEAQTTVCARGAVQFSTPIPFLVSGEPGFRQESLQFGPNQKWTEKVGGTDYTLAFAGITDAPVWTGTASEVLTAVGGQPGVAGYVWATLDPPSLTTVPQGQCGCYTPPPGVPEPATWLLAGIGFVGAAAARKRLRRVDQ